MTVERPFTERSLWRVDASAYDADNKTGVHALGLTGNQDNDGYFIALSNEREVGEMSRLDWFVSHNRQRELIRHTACYTPETIAGVLNSASIGGGRPFPYEIVWLRVGGDAEALRATIEAARLQTFSESIEERCDSVCRVLGKTASGLHSE